MKVITWFLHQSKFMMHGLKIICIGEIINHPINDERRNECAKTKYIDLSQEEKEKDIVIADNILFLI